jgi:hypothetical protein
MKKFEEVAAVSFEFDGLVTTGYLEDERTIEAVDKLNSIGLEGILAATRLVRVDNKSIPLSIVNPVSDRSDDPLGEFENGVVLRTFGAANGQRITGQQVLSALVAEISGKPVISVSLPDRDWSGASIPDITSPWSKLSDKQKKTRSLEHLDGYSAHVLESVDRLFELENGEAKLHFSGESMGAAVALSLAYEAKNFDRMSIAIAALPNNERRHLYRQLFFGDFVKSNEGMHEQVTAGNPRFEPFVEAQGYKDGPKKEIYEIVSGASYMLRDLFGLLPFDTKMQLYRSNRALTRSLLFPSSMEMIERLNYDQDANGRIQLFAAFFKDDLVAKPEAFRKIASPRTSPKNAEFLLFEGNHTATNNPYIIANMAARLVA